MYISQSYQNLLVESHNNKFFSGGSQKFNFIANYITADISTILDFGCCWGELVDKISTEYPNINCQGYDPGVSRFMSLPNKPSDMLICLDVLEHIELEFLESNLQLIDTLFTKKAVLLVACYPAGKYLPNGKNAHLIIENDQWWEDKFSQSINGHITNKISHDVGKGFEHIYLIEKS